MDKVKQVIEKEVQIPVGENLLKGILTIPEDAKGMIIFSHGIGIGRHSVRNQWLAHYLQGEGYATLLFDLLTAEEEQLDQMNYELRFNIPLLAARLSEVTEWILANGETHNLPLGYFGASTGAAAAMIVASELRGRVMAVVSGGGRPDLAGSRLSRIQAPTLLIVGGADFGVIELNERSFAMLDCAKKMEVVAGATHHFEESGALEEVSRMAVLWFDQHLGGQL